MSLLLAMLPFYLLGNLHCMGMCGPMVMMIGQHHYRFAYFLGRTFSFSLAGLFAGLTGYLIDAYLQQYQIASVTSILFGSVIMCVGIFTLVPFKLPPGNWISKRAQKANSWLSLLILRDGPWPMFLFGFFTILLPCGQTIIVFSACALSGDAMIGLMNGFAFALLTSPSLLFAMHARRWLKLVTQYQNMIMGSLGIIVGLFAICRGLAERGVMHHWVISEKFHVVMF